MCLGGGFDEERGWEQRGREEGVLKQKDCADLMQGYFRSSVLVGSGGNESHDEGISD